MVLVGCLVGRLGFMVYQPLKVLLNFYTAVIGMMVRVFTNNPGDLGLIQGRVIPKTQKNAT